MTLWDWITAIVLVCLAEGLIYLLMDLGYCAYLRVKHWMDESKKLD